MAVERTIRVIRTWDIVVEAEYGETDADLMAKVSETELDEGIPDAETRVILENHASEYETLDEYEAATAPAQEV